MCAVQRSTLEVGKLWTVLTESAVITGVQQAAGSGVRTLCVGVVVQGASVSNLLFVWSRYSSKYIVKVIYSQLIEEIRLLLCHCI